MSAPAPPPHSVKITRTAIVVKVTLHRIPPQCISYDATAAGFHLDTNKFSKKWVLDFPWPVPGVQHADATAELEYGILTVTTPVVHAHTVEGASKKDAAAIRPLKRQREAPPAPVVAAPPRPGEVDDAAGADVAVKKPKKEKKNKFIEVRGSHAGRKMGKRKKGNQ